MIAALKSRAMGWALGGLALMSAYLYWQHVTHQRDAYQTEAKRQRERAEILHEHQQWQRPLEAHEGVPVFFIPNLHS